MGWGFGNGLRAEIEGDYRNNKSNGFTQNSGSSIGALGGGTTEQKYGAMANVLYDFNGLTPWFVPYIGAGVGYQWINEKWNVYNNLPFTVPTFSTFGGSSFGPGSFRQGGRSTEGSFAYQAILGAAFPLPTVVPGLAFTAEYRFLGTTGNRSYTLLGPQFRPLAVSPNSRPASPWARATTTRSLWACATTSALRRRRRRRLPHQFRPKLQRARIWCSSIGTRRRLPTVHARSFAKRRTTRPGCSTRASK